jgi:glycosyltransferase involved in cell wall biosynthesis
MGLGASSNAVKLSIVIPAYNEAPNIRQLFDRILDAVKKMGVSFELVFIDDGSTDNTYDEIQHLPVSGFILKSVKLRRNFGKAIALSVGFEKATGEIVITMDADLQDDPHEIPKFMAKIEEGWDVVSGWKKIRNDPLEKRLASKVFNSVVSFVSGLKLHDFNCGFKAYRQSVVRHLQIYEGQHRFIPVIVANLGFSVGEISVTHFKRKYGKSKYGLSRYPHGMFDFFTIIFLMFFRRRPLHFLGRVASLPLLGGTLLVCYVIVMKYAYGETGDRPALAAGIFLIGTAFQIFFFGLIAELITHLRFSSSFKSSDYSRCDDERIE